MSFGQTLTLISLLGVLIFLDMFSDDHELSMQDPPRYSRHDVRRSTLENGLGVVPNRDSGHHVEIGGNAESESVFEAAIDREVATHFKGQPSLDFLPVAEVKRALDFVPEHVAVHSPEVSHNHPVVRNLAANPSDEVTHNVEVTTQPKGGDFLETALNREDICPGCCPSGDHNTSSPIAWSMMAAVASIMSELNAPYVLHSGALLGLVRDCDLLGEDDVGFEVEREWYFRNFYKVWIALGRVGFEMVHEYGNLGYSGYAETWRKDNVTIDIMSYDVASNGFSWTLWTESGSIPNPCFTPALDIQRYTWKGVHVRIPVPIRPAMEATYGSDYMKKQRLIWKRHPFEYSCKLIDPFKGSEWQSSLHTM